ncbi:MAG: hypothetical protein IJR68_03540, partial [Fretibacterium sp.]|nr:hypothetical protein [Fretibacterium sp.]
MVIKHPNVITDVNVNTAAGVEKVSVDNVPAGNYEVKTVASTTYEAALGAGTFAGAAMDGGTTVTGKTITGGTEIKGYALNATGEPVFDSVGERSMTIRVWSNGATAPTDYEFKVDKDYTEGGTIDEGTALQALVDDLDTFGTTTITTNGHHFHAALNPSTGKIELTVSHAPSSTDAVRVELVEQTSAAPDERTGIDYIMGKDTPVDTVSTHPTSIEVLTSTPYTPWNSGDGVLNISVLDIQSATAAVTADISIPAEEAGTIDELVAEMNTKIAASALRGLVTAEKVGDSAFHLISTKGTVHVSAGAAHGAKDVAGNAVYWYDAFGF